MLEESRVVRRTGPMMAMGIVHMVLGVVAVLCGVGMCVMFVWVSRTLRELEANSAILHEETARLEAQHAAAEAVWAPAPFLGAGVIMFGVLLLVSGKGLLSMRHWARGLTLGLAWLAIAAWVVVAVAEAVKGNWFGGADLGVIYWVLAVVLLMSREWKRAYAPPEPAASDTRVADLRFN